MPAVLAEMVCAESVAGRIAESARRARVGRLGIILFYTRGLAWMRSGVLACSSKRPNTGILHCVQNDEFFCRDWIVSAGAGGLPGFGVLPTGVGGVVEVKQEALAAVEEAEAKEIVSEEGQDGPD